MRSVNKVILIGNVGIAPEVRDSTGRKFASFRLATTDRWREKETGQDKEKTEWHNVVVFSEGLVSIVQSYVRKGSRLYVEGYLTTRKYQDKAGVEKYVTEVTVGRQGTIVLLDEQKASAGSEVANGHAASSKSQPSEVPFSDEIPF